VKAIYLKVHVIYDSNKYSGINEITEGCFGADYNNHKAFINTIYHIFDNVPNVKLNDKFYYNSIVEKWKLVFKQ
jgi:hypothetical protein